LLQVVQRLLMVLQFKLDSSCVEQLDQLATQDQQVEADQQDQLDIQVGLAQLDRLVQQALLLVRQALLDPQVRQELKVQLGLLVIRDLLAM